MNKTLGLLIAILVLSVFSIFLVTAQQGGNSFFGIITALGEIRDAITNNSPSESECEFEKLNEKYNPIRFPVQGQQQWFTDSDRLIQIPKHDLYDEVLVTEGIIQLSCSIFGGHCRFLVNNNSCLNFTESVFDQFIDLPQSCINHFVKGNNIITLEEFNADGTVRELYLELEVKPANC